MFKKIWNKLFKKEQPTPKPFEKPSDADVELDKLYQKIHDVSKFCKLHLDDYNFSYANSSEVVKVSMFSGVIKCKKQQYKFDVNYYKYIPTGIVTMISARVYEKPEATFSNVFNGGWKAGQHLTVMCADQSNCSYIIIDDPIEHIVSQIFRYNNMEMEYEILKQKI